MIDDARFRSLVVAALIGISPRQLPGQRAASAVDSVRAVAEAIIAADNTRDIERVLRRGAGGEWRIARLMWHPGG